MAVDDLAKRIAAPATRLWFLRRFQFANPDGEVALLDRGRLGGAFNEPVDANQIYVYIVDGTTGAVTGTLTSRAGEFNAQVNSITWVKSGHDAASVFIPKDNALITSIVEMSITSEIRIARGAVTIFWGVPVRTMMDAEGLDVQCQGVSIYLAGRSIGETAPANLLTGGDMDDPLTDWTKVDPAPGTLTGVADVVYYKNGGTSLRIVGTDRATDTRPNGDIIAAPIDPENYSGEDRYYKQTTGSLFASAAGPTVCVVSAWYFVHDDASTWVYDGKPFDRRGLYARTLTSVGADTGRQWYIPIDDSTERNVWHRGEFEILVYPTEKVEVRLYHIGAEDASPGSAINWDVAGLHAEDQLSFYGTDYLGTDVVEIVEGIVEHSQGLAVLGNTAPANKTDFNLRGDPANTAVGTKLTVGYDWSDHANAWESISDFVGFDGGVDFRVTWSADLASRYLLVGRQLGSLKTAYNLQIDGASSNVINMDYAKDGTTVANSITVLGDGDGADRARGTAVDYSSLGVAWEMIEKAPRNWPIDMLQQLAAGMLADRATPCASMTVRLADSDFAANIVGNLFVGDSVQVTGTWGSLSMSAQVMEIGRMTYNPLQGITVLELT
jgi:hypothetical protein